MSWGYLLLTFLTANLHTIIGSLFSRGTSMREIAHGYDPIRDYFTNELWNPDHDVTVNSIDIDPTHQRLYNTGLYFICNASRNNFSARIQELDAQGYKIVTVCETAYTVCGEPSYSQVSLWGKEKFSKKFRRFLQSSGLLR